MLNVLAFQFSTAATTSTLSTFRCFFGKYQPIGLISALLAIESWHQSAAAVSPVTEPCSCGTANALIDWYGRSSTHFLIGKEWRSGGSADFRRLGEVRAVLIGACWTGYLGGPDALVMMKSGMSSTLNTLEGMNLRVVIMASGPEMPFPVPACLLRRSIEVGGVARNQAEARRVDVKAVIDRAGSRSNVAIVDPFDTFCDSRECFPQIGEAALFIDSDHFSVGGSRALFPSVQPVLDWALDVDRSP